MQVFLKFPAAGQVKTRLAAGLDESAAVAAYRAMVARVLEELPEEFSLSIAYAPAELGEEALWDWLRPHLERGGRSREQVLWMAQLEVPGLGDRLREATGRLFAAGADRVLVVGTDCPYLKPEIYRQAAGCLDRGSDVVFGPAADGGYYLVGLAAPRPEIFAEAVVWSSRQTLATSLEAARWGTLLVLLISILLTFLFSGLITRWGRAGVAWR